MAAVYESARIWERHCRVTSHTIDSRRNPYTYSTPSSSSTSHFSSTAASSTNPVPIDLDVFTPHPNWSSRAPTSKTSISQVRCYNCQKYGHFAKDCPIPDRQKAYKPSGGLGNRPGRTSQPMFYIGDPAPLQPGIRHEGGF
ncbi:hypothetical protein GGU11DRAFT_751325 [Lentinula aff. detonsa]|nr:hypothetical protein GGU11DRAFT_751325 [Lentinula aff. detonsa]